MFKRPINVGIFMITKSELSKVISELENAPMNYANCEKLACFYTIRNNLFEEQPAKIKTADVKLSGNSDFLSIVNNKNLQDVFAVIDELMETLKITNNRLYEGVMRKIEKL